MAVIKHTSSQKVGTKERGIILREASLPLAVSFYILIIKPTICTSFSNLLLE
jgi:hypothetical protein